MFMFAYGMNCNVDQMKFRCPLSRAVGHAVLPGHKFRFAHHADIIPSSANQVDGVLWEITEECKNALDMLESFPNYYNIKNVMVKCNDAFYEACVYYMNPGNDNAAPSIHYLTMILDGYKSFNVPKRQVEVALRELNLSI